MAASSHPARQDNRLCRTGWRQREARRRGGLAFSNVALYELDDPGPLIAPVLVVALDGWVNAGQAGTEAAEVLAGDGPVIATFDADSLFDYRVNRPTIDFVEGVIERVIWPELTLRHRKYSARDLLILAGTEPNWNWKRLGRELADLAIRLGVVEHVSLGGIPWAVPHTRPVTVIVTASHRSRLHPEEEHPEGVLRVPGSAVSVLEHAMNQSGIPSTGLWARVPQYIGTPYHAAALALVERVSRLLAIDPATHELEAKADEQRRQLDQIVAGRPDLAAMVSQLEAIADEQGVVSGEQLAAEIERFLKERGDGSGTLGQS